MRESTRTWASLVARLVFWGAPWRGCRGNTEEFSEPVPRPLKSLLALFYGNVLVERVCAHAQWAWVATILLPVASVLPPDLLCQEPHPSLCWLHN